MELFAHDADIAELEVQKDHQAGVSRIERLLALAWYKRQSNNAQALLWVSTIQSELPMIDIDRSSADCWLGRCLLIQAETGFMETNLSAANELAVSALQLFSLHNDQIGIADSLLLRALVCGAKGDLPARDALLLDASKFALLGQDRHRVSYLRANQARFAVLQNVQNAEAKWPDLFFYPPEGHDIYVHAAISAMQGTREYLLGNYTGAIEAFEHAYSWSFDTGQVASAVTAAVNIGGINEVLNDHTASIEAIERALELARPTGWRLLVGPATRQRAEALCNLGHYETAMRCAAEARVYYEHLTNSRNYGALLITSGDIAERLGDHAQALKFYYQCADLARNLSQADLLIDGLLGAAKSYLKAQQIEKAETCASHALQVANESGVRLLQTTAVQLQAKVAKAKGDRRSELDHLLTAVSHAEALQGYLIPHEVLLELANAYAEDGRYELAYETSIKAHNAREKVLNAEASNRATAMQIRIAAERSRAELEHQRKLLAFENERASTLQTVNEKLQELTDELHLKNIELDQRSNTDRLTGLANRMRLDAVLEQELARSQRGGAPFALILLDIDKFKSVNDTYGHQVGDKVLIEVSRLLASSVRPYDVVGRWGGEEFLMVCGNTDLEGAVALAEKLRASLASHAIDLVGIRTGSFGVGVYSSGENIESLLSRADAALYRAKERGRNRVEF